MRSTRHCRGTRVLLSRLFFVTILLLGGLLNTAAATPPGDQAIVEEMRSVFDATQPRLSQLMITVRNDEGEEQARWVASLARKQVADGQRTLMVLLEPEALQHNAVLIGEGAEQAATMWLFTPAIQRVRGITPVDAYERFLRTDFTFSDLGFVHRRSTYRVLGEDRTAGVRAYMIEEVPQDPWYYSRILTWVTADSLLPLRREYYDRAGRLWKTEVFDQITVINGVPTPLRIRMHDLQQGTTTELQIREVRFDLDLPDALFQPQGLREVATSPLWQSYRTQIAHGAPGTTTLTR